MSRLLAFTLIVSLGSPSAALAGGSLRASAARLAREAARNQTLPQRHSDVAVRVPTDESPSNRASTPAQSQTGLATSRMSTRKKILIGLAAGAGFAAAAYIIDHKVQDVTPSSLGTRQDR